MQGAGPDLLQFLEKEGHMCCVCLEPYIKGHGSPQPIGLSCGQHDTCMKCFDQLKQLKQGCPNCRKPLDFTIKAVNSTKLNAVETAIRLWQATHSNGAANAGSPVNHFAPEQIDEPEQWSGRDWLGGLPKFIDVRDKIACIMPQVVQAMAWDGDAAKDLQTEFDKPDDQWAEWLALIDSERGDAKGFVQIKRPLRSIEIHWAGVVDLKESLDHYVELYCQAVNYASSHYPVCTWESEVTCFLNYDTETKQYRLLQRLLVEKDWDPDAQTLVKRWGVQKKLTVRPVARHGHVPRQPLPIHAERYKLCSVASEKRQRDALCEQIFSDEGLKLAQVFRLCSVYDGSGGAEELKESFIAAPQSFYVYTIAGLAQGFAQMGGLKSKSGVMLLRKIGLAPVQMKYKQHFLRAFIQWVFSSPKQVDGHKVRSLQYCTSDGWGRDLVQAAQALELPVTQVCDDGQIVTEIKPQGKK